MPIFEEYGAFKAVGYLCFEMEILNQNTVLKTNAITKTRLFKYIENFTSKN